MLKVGISLSDIRVMKLNGIPVEKDVIRRKLLSGLSLQNPSVFFETCRELEVLDIICKPLYDCIGVEQDPIHHAEDLYHHSLRTVDEAAKLTTDPLLRLSAMLHDQGKRDCRKEIEADK